MAASRWYDYWWVAGKKGKASKYKQSSKVQEEYKVNEVEVEVEVEVEGR